METIGFVGVGKIGMPISQNLIKSGHRVVGYRRHSLAEFEKIGGVPARSAADVGAQADIVLSCLPSTEALDEVVHGPHGLIQSARPGQIVVELGSHPVPDKKRQIAPLAEKGAVFIDGEVSGTPGMVSARKGVIYLAGDADGLQEGRAAWSRASPIPASISASSAPRAASSSSIIFWSRSTSRPRRRRWRSGSKAGVDVPLMIKAIATGSGGSTQFGIRAPWMAERRFQPVQGDVPGLQHYFDMIKDFADHVGVATPLLDCVVPLYQRFMDMGLGDNDVAAMVDVIGALPRAKTT